MEKKIYVYENWSSNAPRKLGKLFIDSICGDEHSSFQFDAAFLANACASQMLMLDPDLSLVKGRQVLVAEKSTFGIFWFSRPTTGDDFLWSAAKSLTPLKKIASRTSFWTATTC